MLREPDHPHDWFYVSYACINFAGAMVLPQLRGEDTSIPNPNGFNFTEAMKIISHHHQQPAIINYWTPITRARAVEWAALMDHIHGGELPGPPGRVLKLVPKEEMNGPNT